jgi:hypothetical protein
MTIKDTGEMLAIIKEAYPNFFKDQSDPGPTVKVWHSFLSDLGAELALMAIRSHISTSKFPPTIAEIRHQAYQITAGERLTADEAWGLTIKAVQRFGHYQVIDGLLSLPPKVRKIAQSMGWDALCMANLDTIGVERGQFIKLYNSSMERDEERNMIPERLLEMIDQMGQKLLANNR